MAFDRVAYAAGVFSSLRPRRPASGDGFNPANITKRVGLVFGFGLVHGSGVAHGSWPEAGSESCETRTLRAGADLARQKWENDLLSDVLAQLAELDERRLYLDLGYRSLFAYCTEALGLRKSSAGRRIAAARVCLRYPEAFVRVAEGQLQLSVLFLLGQYLKPDNAAELFDACSRKNFEQVELLLAARFPKPNVRDLIRRLPARSQASAPHVAMSGVEFGTRLP